jgi:hypothetical protein
MKSRKQIEIQKINLLVEKRYFENKFLNEDIKYQITPNGSEEDNFIIKAFEGESFRELNSDEQNIVGDKPLSQKEALEKLKELQNNLTK